MDGKLKIIIGLLSALLVLGAILVFSGNKGGNFGAYDESYTNFTKLKATEAFINEGTTTLSGAATLSGTSTFSGATTFLQTASTTVTVGSTANVGCVALGSASGTQLVYLSATSGAVILNATKPAYCK